MNGSSLERLLQITVIFAVTMLLPPSAGALEQKREGPMRLTVIWYDPSDLLPWGLHLVADEVSSIFGTLGVEVALEETKADPVVIMPGELLAILLSRGPDGWREDSNVLGAVKLSRQKNIRVYYDNVLHVLGFSRGAVGRMLMERERTVIARALGRVLAHELIHAVASPHAHADSGVFHQRLNQKELTRTKIVVDSACSIAFVNALRARPKLASPSY